MAESYKVLPERAEKRARADFLQDETDLEGKIEELTDELHAKLVHALVSASRGEDTTIPASESEDLERSVRRYMEWYVSEMEDLITEGARNAARHAMDGEKRAHDLYFNELKESVGEDKSKRIDSLLKRVRKQAKKEVK